MGEPLDCALHNGRSIGITLREDSIQLLLAYLFAAFIAERVFTILPQDLSHLVKHAAEGTFARLVAYEALLILYFEVIAVDLYTWQGFRAVGGERTLAFPVRHRVLSLEPSSFCLRCCRCFNAWN